MVRKALFPLTCLALGLACGSSPPAAPDPCVRTDLDVLTPNRPLTPRWAFEPWISKDISTGPDTYDFVDGFRQRDIPIGAVVLDSPWETHYNTYVPNPSRYPDFAKLVADMHARNVRVVLWTTQMINTTGLDSEPGGDTYPSPSPRYDEGAACHYYVDDGASYFWWKGFGSGVDFASPSATAWLHRQEDNVLDLGIDGWKLDFGESYISNDPVATAKGPESRQAYSESYYADFLAYGRKKRGDDFLTMVRAYDESYGFKGRFFAQPKDAPVAWMGDNRRDWIGLVDALDEMFRSAKAGYAVLGSDVGGYLDRDDKNLAGPVIPFDLENFHRWIALGALTPFMQLHGRANLTPWAVPGDNGETVPIYRFWAKLHHALVPFFASVTKDAWAKGASVVVPVGDVGDYRFALGDAFFVAPLIAPGGTRDVAFPAGARYVDYWDDTVHDGGTTAAAYDAVDRMRYPLFLKEGAIVPMEADGGLTVLVVPAAQSAFTLVEEDGSETKLGASGKTVTIDRALRTTIFRVFAETAPTKVSRDGTALPQSATRPDFDASTSSYFVEGKRVWIKIAAGAGASLTLE